VVLEVGPQVHRLEVDLLGHGVKGLHRPVEESADPGRDGENLGLTTYPFPGEDDLGGGGALGPGELAVHLDHEVVTQGNQEEHPQAAAQEGDHDDLQDRGLVGDQALPGEHVEGGNREHRPRDHVGGVGADRLGDHVLEHGAPAAHDLGDADGEDGDGNRRLDALTELEGHVGRCHGEHGAEHETEAYRSSRDLQDAVSRHHGHILLSRLQWAPGVLRKRCHGFVGSVLHVSTSSVANLSSSS